MSLTGKWTHTKSEDFEKFLKAMGVGMIQRKAAATMSPTMTISNDGGETWTIVVVLPIKTTTMTAKLGEKFEQETPQGKKVSGTLTMESPSRLVVTGEDGVNIVREVDGDHLAQTMTTASGVTCVRHFKRV